MSLESIITDLVASTNGLINAFNNKKAGIDAAVAAALQTIPNNSRWYYVDAVAGNDAGAGSTADPLKTVAKAVALTPVGGVATIYLAAGQEHQITAHVGAIAKTLVFSRYGDGARPILRSMPFVGSGLNLCYGLIPSGGSCIVFIEMQLKCAGMADAALPVSGYGFISRADRTSGEIFTYNCDLEIDRSGFVAGASAGSMLSLALYNTTVSRPGGAGFLLSTGTNPARLMVNAVTLPAGTVLTDLLAGIVRDSSNVPRNLSCNLVI